MLSVDRDALRRYIERSVHDLPALPAVVAKVVEITESPDASSAALNQVISSDQALSAKVLRVVNSAYYGLSAQVSTTSHAIVILGMQQVRNLVLSMAAMSLVRSRSAAMGQMHVHFWRHAFGTAKGAERIAKLKHLPVSEIDRCFIGALLHDIGMLFLYSTFTDLYTRTLLDAKENNMPLHVAEEKFLGIDHTEVGRMLATAWRFPPEIRKLIGEHHEPQEGEFNGMRACIQAADYYANAAGFSPLNAPVPDMLPEVRSWLEFDEEDEAAMTEFIREKIREAEELFGLIV